DSREDRERQRWSRFSKLRLAVGLAGGVDRLSPRHRAGSRRALTWWPRPLIASSPPSSAKLPLAILERTRRHGWSSSPSGVAPTRTEAIRTLTGSSANRRAN